MIKLKSLLKENNPFDKLGGTSDANRITGGQRDPRTGNMMVDPKNLKVSINRADYDTNISGIVSMNFQGSQLADKNTFHDIIDDIKQDIESKNDPTGAYDQTRLVSDITFDCELKVGTDTIDLTVTYDEDGDIQNVEIQDEDIATKYGISDSTIMDYLF
jgi:predicted DNA binding protein